MIQIAFLIPAFNVRPWTPSFVSLLNEGFAALRATFEASIVVVFVDDGSERSGTNLDDHRRALRTLDAPVIAARHGVNRGQGAALQTALEIARTPPVSADYYVTFDSDGQHDPTDVSSLLAKLRDDNLNIVFGNRFIADAETVRRIPLMRRWMLRLAVVFERFVTGLHSGDAHNGLRVFDRETASKINLRQDRMAHATEIKLIVSRYSLRYGEVPVRISYGDYRLKEGQRNSEAARIVVDLLENWWLQ